MSAGLRTSVSRTILDMMKSCMIETMDLGIFFSYALFASHTFLGPGLFLGYPQLSHIFLDQLSISAKTS